MKKAKSLQIHFAGHWDEKFSLLQEIVSDLNASFVIHDTLPSENSIENIIVDTNSRIVFFINLNGIERQEVVNWITETKYAFPVAVIGIMCEPDLETELFFIEKGIDEVISCQQKHSDDIKNIIQKAIARERSNSSTSQQIRQFKHILQNQCEGSIIVDPDYKILFCNNKAEEIFGQKDGELVGKYYTDFIDESGLENFKKNTAGRSSGETNEYLQPIVRTDGQRRIFNISASPWYDENFIFSGAFALINDITEQLQQQEELQRQATTFANLWEGIILTDEEGYIIDWNPAAEKISGFSREEVLSNHVTDLFPKLISIKTFNEIRRELINRNGWSAKMPYVNRQGTTQYIELALVPILNSKNEITGSLGVVRDLTEQVIAEEVSLESKQRLENILNAFPDVLLVIDKKGKILEVIAGDNQPLFDFINKYMGKNFNNIFPQKIRKSAKEKFDLCIQANLPTQFEYYTGTKNRKQYFEMRYIISSDGNILAILRDITDKRIAEQKLIESENRFRAIVNDQTELIARRKLDNTITFVNKAFCKFFNKDYTELINTKWVPDLLESDKTIIRNAINQLKVDKEFISVQHRIILPNKNICWQSWKYRAIKDEEGNLVEYQGVGTDITERKYSIEALERSQKLLSQAQKIANFGSYELNLESHEFDWSDVTFNIFDLDKSDKTPTLDKLLTLIPEKDRDKFSNKFTKDIKVENQFRFDQEFIIRKTKRDIHVIGEAVTDDENKVTLIRGAFHDITERKRYERQMTKAAEELAERNKQLNIARQDAEKAKEAVEKASKELREAYEETADARKIAEKANEAKTMFLANMSHEIRTPLTSILGFAKLFRDRAMDSESITYLDHIISSGHHLLNLINDILDLSRVESGSFSLQPEAFDFRVLMEEILSTHKQLADEKGLNLNFKITGLKQQVILDRSRVRQIVTNLLSNAIKFTNEGEVNLQIHQTSPETGVSIVVNDTGPGIPEDKQQQIFEPFVQLIEAGSTPSEGTGLGLAITNRLVNAMKGSIEMDSKENIGTNFIIKIPCKMSTVSIETYGLENNLQEAGNIVINEEKQYSLRILVADDNAANRNLIQYTLEKAGHDVHLVEDGLMAVQAFARQSFDIAIIDVQMPKMDGYEAIKNIRRLPGGDIIPILCLTAFAMKGDREKSLAKGADEYLSKPYSPGDLLHLIEKLTGYKHTNVITSPVQTDSFASLNNDPEMVELKQQYLESIIDEADQLFADPPSFEEIKIWGHRLAGSGGSFGYMELSRMGRSIENGGKEENLELIKNELVKTSTFAKSKLDEMK